jgi:glycosyltransferase involved in cell wall biosynthesis
VDCKNVDGFAKRIVELLLDKKLRTKMGEEGRQRFKQHFTAERMAWQYADLIYAGIRQEP